MSTDSTQETAPGAAPEIPPLEPDVSQYNAELVERHDFAKGLSRFRIKFADQEVPDFTPGQYATIGLYPPQAKINELAASKEQQLRDAGKDLKAYQPRLVRRAYSIASSPLEKGYVEFYIVMVEDGALTPLLWDLEPGDPLFMDPRLRGTFTLDDVPPTSNLVFVCTGTGLAPFLSMLRTYREGRAADDAPWNHVVLVHGARLADDLGYRALLEEWGTHWDDFTYISSVTREPAGNDWQGLRGRVTEFLQPEPFERLTGIPLDASNCRVFLCGNPAMIDQCEEELQQFGFTVKDRKNPEGNIHFERYW